MKIITGSFQFESNSLTTVPPSESDFEYFEGNDIYKKLDILDLLSDFCHVPTIYANALPGGVLEYKLFCKYKNKIINTIKENLDADGIFLAFHGSSEVENIGSGELELLKELRETIGYKCLVSVSMDLHANIHPEFVKYANIICGYKTAPHIDQRETQRRAVSILTSSLLNGSVPTSVMVKVPMLIRGDTMITENEPLKTLIQAVLQQEKTVLQANLFFAHMWVDGENVSASVVVTDTDRAKAEKVALFLARKFWDTRDDYKFTVEADSVINCVKLAISAPENRVFITDSGDNTTAGAEGNKLEILREILKHKTHKKICIAGITNKEIVEKAKSFISGEQFLLEGMKFTYLYSGRILGWAKEDIGSCIAANIEGVDVIFTEKRSAFISRENFEMAKCILENYNIIVVKLGYLFDELKPYCDKAYFAFSNGTSCVDISRLNLKKIPRPMFPLDKIDDVKFKIY